MTEDAKVALLVTDESCRDSAAGSYPCVYIDSAQPGEEGLALPPHSATGSSRTHILYTSGSTGQPKGVEIVGRAISRLVLETNYLHLVPGDRVGQLASFCFDASLFELWGPLLCGATLVPLLERQVVDPFALRAELAAARVDVLFLTTALFNITAQTCPDAFAGLRTLMTGGERANPEAMRTVLECGAAPEQLWHVYGPTESTVFATAHRVELEDLEGERVTIGGPIRNTRVFILGPDSTPVPQGSPGELCIGGDGLARGYLNQVELTEERFVTVEGLDTAGPCRVYRTGDWAAWREDGTIDFLGRRDFQVKLRGFRIELEEVEAALLETKQVRAAVARVEQAPERLVAWVVPDDPERFEPDAVKAALRQTLPAYMVPAQLRALSQLPLTPNNKIDRKAVAELVAVPVFEGEPSQGDLEALVAAAWCEVLGTGGRPDDDFFELGGESLLAARLVLRVHQTLGVRVPVNALYAASTLEGFTASVRAALVGEIPQDFGQGDASLWRRDAALPEDLARTLRAARARGGSVCGLLEAKTVLLTGATGFLGAFLLRELLDRSAAEIVCLVRAASESEGAARLESTLRKYGLWAPGLLARVHPLLGDLREPQLGLSAQRHAALARELDVIVHNGAYVNYAKPYSAHRATNVLGTREILRLAARERLKPVHYLSTIAVFGPCGYLDGVERLREDEPLERFAEGLRYDIGYAQSKWAAEQLVWAAGRCGAPVAVFRPGFIMGDSRSGLGNPDDFVARLVAGCAMVGAAPQLPRQRKEFVTVDYVSRLLVSVAARRESLGHGFHLIPPEPQLSIDLDEFFTLIEQAGLTLQRVPYADWVQRLLEHPDLMHSALMPLVPMLCERIYEDRATRWELYENMPEYEATQASAVARSAGIAFTPMSVELAAAYLESWAEAGLLPGEGRGSSTRAAG